MKIFILDGLNIIHKDASLRKLFNASLETAEKSLVAQVKALLTKSGNNRFIIVYDGKGSFSEPSFPNLSVVFASSADDKIKELIKSGKPRNMVVVSSDIEIHNFARLYSAQPLSSSDFIDDYLIEKIKRKNYSKIKNTHKNEKPLHETKAEIERLKNIFKKNID